MSKKLGSNLKTFATASSFITFIGCTIGAFLLWFNEYPWWSGIILFVVGCLVAFGLNRIIYYVGEHIEETSPEEELIVTNSATINECPNCFHPIENTDIECKYCGYILKSKE